MTTSLREDIEHRGPDRRHPRVTTDVLRRHLREADGNLFTARASLAAAAAAPPKRRVPRKAVVIGAAILAAAAATAVWAARVPNREPQADDIRVQVTAVPRPPVFRTAEPTVNDAPLVSGKRRWRPKALHQARAATARERGRRRVPRPLSPGEFGRTAGTRTN